MNIEVPNMAAEIINRLENAGFSAYLVGGCVRDSLRGAKPSDFDIATSAKPDEMYAALSGYTILPTGIKHGTVTVTAEDQSFEVTTFRVDGQYSDHRRPDSVTFSSDITKDLSRRDFTINAMAYHPKRGLVDPFNGSGDIKNRIIRCVGNPIERFNEDALRILRAARFSSRFDYDIEKDTLFAMKESACLLKNISSERVFSELCGAIIGKGFSRVFLTNPFLLTTVIPEIKDTVGFIQNSPYHSYDVYEHTIRAVDAGLCELTIRLALLFHDIGKPGRYTQDEKGIGHFKGHATASAEITDRILKRLKSSNALRREVCELIKYHSAILEPEEHIIRRWLNRIGKTQLRRLIEVMSADNSAKSPEVSEARREKPARITAILDRVLAEEQAYTIKNLALSGKDIMSLGLREGPEVGRILSLLLDKVIDGELINSRESLIEEVISIKELLAAGIITWRGIRRL